MTFRLAEASDIKLYFDWANDPEVRQQSHNTEPILWENHVKWFNKMIDSALMLIFFEGEIPVGQLRVVDGFISFSVDSNHRGKGIATEMLRTIKKIKTDIKGEVKQTNKASLKAFQKAGFKLESIVKINGVDCSVFVITPAEF